MDEKKILDLVKKNQKIYLQEEKRREGIKKRLSDKWGFLVEDYHQFAADFEREISYMYLDSSGFPTVGCGHLLGYDWWHTNNNQSFWQQEAVRRALQTLGGKLQSKSSIDYPEQVVGVFEANPLDEATLLEIFKIECVRNGLLEAIHFPFEKGEGTKQRGKIVQVKKTPLKQTDSEKERTIAKTYIHLIALTLMLCAREQGKGSGKRNPFLGRGFYDSQDNYIVLSDDGMKKLTELDILCKIADLVRLVPNFSSIPIEAQKGILDLSFTGTNELSKCRNLVGKEDWGALQMTSAYGRSDRDYGARNRAVADLFKEASRKLQPAGKI